MFLPVFLQGESLPPGELGEHVGCNGLYYNSFSPLESTVNVEDVAHSGYYGLDQNSFPAQQSPVSPVQRSSSYPGGFSNDCNMPNFQFESTQVDVNPQWAVQDKYRAEENGHIMSPGFNSSKSLSTEANFGDSSDTATQSVNAWAYGYFPIAAGEYYFDSMYEPQLYSAGEYY